MRSGRFVTVMCKRVVSVLRSVVYILSSLKFAVTVLLIFNLQGGFPGFVRGEVGPRRASVLGSYFPIDLLSLDAVTGLQSGFHVRLERLLSHSTGL